MIAPIDPKKNQAVLSDQPSEELRRLKNLTHKYAQGEISYDELWKFVDMSVSPVPKYLINRIAEFDTEIGI